MQTSKRAWVAAAMAALLLLSGCPGQGAGEATPSASSSPHGNEFSGQNLPSKVESLSGTPFYNNSAELASRAKLEGAPFLLIAPLEPTKALLVLEVGSKPADLAQRASQKTDFSGVTESIEAPQLGAFVKESTGLDLKTDESGKVVVLKVQKPAAGTVSMSATPAPVSASATPSVSEGSPTPLDSSAPRGGASASPAASVSPGASATPGVRP
jgi:hypothetical protein